MTRRSTKRITSRGFSIHYVHDGTAEINCCTYSITKIFQSLKAAYHPENQVCEMDNLEYESKQTGP